jgi:hypothetical protein
VDVLRSASSTSKANKKQILRRYGTPNAEQGGMMKHVVLLLPVLLSGCLADDNDKPVYGAESGLPVNCRAYVQVVIDSYRARKYSVDESFAGLERNCGINGHAWKDNR